MTKLEQVASKFPGKYKELLHKRETCRIYKNCHGCPYDTNDIKEEEKCEFTTKKLKVIVIGEMTNKELAQKAITEAWEEVFHVKK